MNKPPVGVGFTAAPGILGNIIRWASDSDVSHTFLFWDDPWFGCQMTLGANANGITLQPLSRMALDKPTLYRGTNDLWPGIIHYIDLINSPYGYASLLEMSVVEAERHLFLRAGARPPDQARVICSTYVSLVLRKSGDNILPEVEARRIDPGQVELWIKANGFTLWGAGEITKEISAPS